MSKINKNTHLDAKDIKKYLDGSAINKHQIEKKTLEDPLTNEALEGFEMLKKDKVDDIKAISDLKARLNNRTQKEKSTIVIVWKSLTIAASIILMIAVSTYFFINKYDTENLSLNKEKPAIENDEIKNRSEEIQDIVNIEKEPTEKPVILKKKEDFKEEKTISNEILLAGTEGVETPLSDQQIEKPHAREVVSAPTLFESKTIKNTVYSGEIVDAENAPIPGVNIKLKNKNEGVSSNANGQFLINNLKEGEVLEINMIGYEPKEIIVKNENLGKIILEENTSSLSEVVVTAQSSAKKSKEPQSLNNQDPKPKIGWTNYDNYLLNSIKQTGAVSTLNFDQTIRFKATIEPSGEISNIQVDEKSIGKEGAQKLSTTIKNGPKWIPAKRKGRKVRKEIEREINLKK
ncbi:hypothetical protein EGI22_00570 [Lacihabitans sp. LS3-19]|uniref:carboxypeptidase-like regulatory domain-containing protein n=1 Tax=Lacihabitans sp. LS3-19 TaxID=2487335 RepID=UPI0020CD29D9|nr:carboxypeptidase-like regulatory domain-containing protein [Lacihabitans sp. LS3-19]MCP9766378.1 hypothetical protein [Lacihabitans sp. LS3-19]